MAVAKMKLVNIVGRLKDFDTVVQECCINGNFHVEQSATALENVKEFHPIDTVNPYEKALQRAIDIGVHADIHLHYSNFEHLDMSAEELGDYVSKAGFTLDALNARVRDLTQAVGRYKQMLVQLEHLKTLKINLDDIFQCVYIGFRFGRLPKDSLPKVNVDHEDIELLFVPLEETDLFYWGFYVARKPQLAQADEFFNSLYFERIPIVEQAHGTPSEASASVQTELENVQKDLQDAQKAVGKYWNANRETFLKVYSKLRYLHDSFDLRKYASEYDDNFYIFGWVPEREIPLFTKQFDSLPHVDCVVEGIEEAPNIEPPTHLVNNKMAKPYEGYLELYGLPLYNEIDPTPIMSITYSVIFGIMFGDIGQGFLILLGALFMKYKKKMFLGDILIRCSIFSMIFGFFYNSFFGYSGERAVLPINFNHGQSILPVENSSNLMTVLLISVAGGVCLIVFCMILNIINGIKQKNPEKTFFSQNGVTGLVFYVAVIGAAALMLIKGSKLIFNPVFIILLVVVPLLIIACKEPLGRLCARRKDWAPKKTGEFIMLAFFELFDIILSFLSNTISYIRIGAFILSHAAMMSAVFTIAKMTGNANNPVALVIGNLFVIGLEGLIVGIQGLRLQFYEMFSRFYEGGGKPYEPVHIRYEN
ncbi:MAG: V-type ATPase 116kDa subunit family protein [Ethanoligenens sp.]